ncbi:MAG: methyltransferase [Acetobacteraceae bacterium]
MTGLPDIGGLAGVPPRAWRELAARLSSIGLNTAGVAPVLGLASRFQEDARDPIRIWHLRQRPDPAAVAMRLLMFGDAVTPEEAAAALGDDLLALLNNAGLLRATEGALRCALRLAVVEDRYVFADDLAPGGDVVMGMRDTTVPLWRATTTARLGRVLDLGCGSGPIALLLAPAAERVVAVDINPRAVALAQVNAALNGEANIEVRTGDLFAPVAGETFDLVAAHPPYVALPEGMAPTSHMFGGPRGDEIAARLAAGLAAHLAPGGHAVIHASWPLRAGETLATRVREAAGPALDLLALRLGTTDADDLATFWGQHGGVPVGQVRDHYARLGIVAADAALCVLRRGGAAAWTATLEVPAGCVGFVTAERIASLLQSCDLLHGDDAALLGARLRLPEGTSLATVESAAGARAMLALPPTTLRPAIEVAPELLRVIHAVNAASSVLASGQPLASVRQALAQGALEPM